MGDVHAPILLRIAEDVSPHGVKQLLMGERSPGVAREHPQQMPLDRRQAELTPATGRHTSPKIEHEIATLVGKSRVTVNQRVQQFRARAQLLVGGEA